MLLLHLKGTLSSKTNKKTKEHSVLRQTKKQRNIACLILLALLYRYFPKSFDTKNKLRKKRLIRVFLGLVFNEW